MSERKYLPTFADLVDRLSIVLLKEIFSGEKKYYAEERKLIEHDLDIELEDRDIFTSEMLRAVLMIAIANRFIWENEGKARAGSDDQNHLLKLTHTVNGVRQIAKNRLTFPHERRDVKVDCLAADLPANWNVFDD